METRLGEIVPVLESLGYTLDKYQPHLSGERFLMSGPKLVLVGRETDSGNRVIIKISRQPSGQKELETEKTNREWLQTLAFTDDEILFPAEKYYGRQNGYLIYVTAFIEQDKIFVEHDLEEQFFTILRAFEAQEAYHATTHEHFRQVKNRFPVMTEENYSDKFRDFAQTTKLPWAATEFFETRAPRLRRHLGYLTHTDFVPHNFRLKNHQIHVLDSASFCFGHKYDGWARLLNYLVVHNPSLETLLLDYLKLNREAEDYESLRLMRIYKLAYLLVYYQHALAQTSGALKLLTEKRLSFWSRVLGTILTDGTLPPAVLEQYLTARDRLRSEDEKKRQREFARA